MFKRSKVQSVSQYYKYRLIFNAIRGRYHDHFKCGMIMVYTVIVDRYLQVNVFSQSDVNKIGRSIKILFTFGCFLKLMWDINLNN